MSVKVPMTNRLRATLINIFTIMTLGGMGIEIMGVGFPTMYVMYIGAAIAGLGVLGFLFITIFVDGWED